VITANGKRIPWIRDRVDMYALHVEAPQDVKALDVNFQFVAPQDPKRGRKCADAERSAVGL